MSISDQEVEAAHQVIWPATEWNDGEHACREIVRLALTAAANARKSEGVIHPVHASAERIAGSYRINLDEPELRAWASDAVKALRVMSALSPLPVVSSPVVDTEMLLAALRGLVLLKELFDVSDRNQADAYYILAKQDGAWGNARSALTAALNPTIGGK